MLRTFKSGQTVKLVKASAEGNHSLPPPLYSESALVKNEMRTKETVKEGATTRTSWKASNASDIDSQVSLGLDMQYCCTCGCVYQACSAHLHCTTCLTCILHNHCHCQLTCPYLLAPAQHHCIATKLPSQARVLHLYSQASQSIVFVEPAHHQQTPSADVCDRSTTLHLFLDCKSYRGLSAGSVFHNT